METLFAASLAMLVMVFPHKGTTMQNFDVVGAVNMAGEMKYLNAVMNLHICVCVCVCVLLLSVAWVGDGGSSTRLAYSRWQSTGLMAKIVPRGHLFSENGNGYDMH